MDENNEYYEDDENLEQDDLGQEESGDIAQQPSAVDSVGKSAAHGLGKAVASHYGGSLGGKAYDAFSQTAIGKALEEKAARKLKLKIYLILIGVAAVFLLFLVIIAFFIDDGTFGDTGSSSACTNLPAIDNVCRSITPEGYETMSVDEYVAGVIKAEIGGMVDDNFNTYKALAVAARTFALAGATKDGNGNCSVPVGPTFQAYSANPDENMLNAASETSGIVLVKDNSITSTQYDALCIESEDDTNYYLCQGGTEEEHLAVSKEWLLSKRSEDYIAWARDAVHGNGMSQNGAWYLALEKGWDYEKILDYFYGDDGFTLASINGASSNCDTSYNGDFKPLETYTLAHNGLNVLNRALTASEITALNEYINSEVDKAGFGTGAGVAAAGQALIYWLEQQGYYLQYRWGGGHSYYTNAGCDLNGKFVGVNPNWGSPSCGYDEWQPNTRIYYGIDCSGFVSWATRTACKPSGFNYLAGHWSYFDGVKHITLSEAKPGDVIDWDKHVQLIVKNNGDGTVIVAEAAGQPTSGVVFSLISSPSGKVVDMSDWYANNCASSR